MVTYFVIGKVPKAFVCYLLNRGRAVTWSAVAWRA